MVPVMQARNIMTVDTLTVRASDNVQEAAQRLVDQGISNAPVVEPDLAREILVGFVSEKDLLQCYASGWFHTRPELRIAEIMRPHPVCVRPETDVFTLAAIFMQHGFRHLPVVTGTNVLEGMVSRRDVLAALLKHYESWRLRKPEDREMPDVAGIFTARFIVG